MNLKYLPGLDSLRFFAAFFVIICHANQSIGKLGYNLSYGSWPVFERGGDAVDFFFTLSGFLITYLLIKEKEATGNISLKNFYLRRVFRIWPLYFIVLIIGFLFFTLVYPIVFKEEYFNFNPWWGFLMFVFFMPNYMARNYNVGLLNPLWSIGVEEQFYLFWAPLVKFSRNHLLPLIIGFISVSTALSLVLNYKAFDIPVNWGNFLPTLKFHSMAVGSLFAYILFYHHAAYTKSIFSSKIVQAIVIVALTCHYLHGIRSLFNPLSDMALSLLYGLLILNVSAIPNKLLNLEIKPLLFLGRISYGLYMYHMLVDYGLRFSFGKLFPGSHHALLLGVSYHVLLLGLTIAVAAFSFTYIEKYFLNLKHRFCG